MIPRHGLRIDLIPRELPLVLVGVCGAALAMQVGAETMAVVPLAVLVSVRVRLRRI
ncbi:hypothetical protein [Streptomyces sp. ACT015]|uniref:hypothetical protein n=1 Tax=Streptomyces sp. ACT015 TaxID=3134807 RepID=UPI003D1840F5